jgi:hypothetical protein
MIFESGCKSQKLGSHLDSMGKKGKGYKKNKASK